MKKILLILLAFLGTINISADDYDVEVDGSLHLLHPMTMYMWLVGPETVRSMFWESIGLRAMCSVCPSPISKNSFLAFQVWR